jgi:hypothetical protein
MGSQEQVYVINAEDILDHQAPEAGSRSGPRGLASVTQEADGGRSTVRGRRGMTFRTNPRAFIASTLSMFVCGAGQAYNGQWKLGLLLFLTEVLAVAGHWSVVKIWPVLKDLGYIFAVGEWEIFVFLAISDFLLIFFLLYNVAQAYHQAEMEGNAFQGFRRPVLSGLASLAIPGWGQLLNAQLGKALFFLFCLLSEIYLGTLLMLSPFLRFAADLQLDRLLARRASQVGAGVLLFGILVWILSAYDAFLVARYRNRQA